MDGDAEDAPQAGEDVVHDLGVSVGAELGGDDGLPDVCSRQEKQAEAPPAPKEKAPDLRWST